MSFSCFVCKKNFARRCNFDKHIDTVHGGLKLIRDVSLKGRKIHLESAKNSRQLQRKEAEASKEYTEAISVPVNLDPSFEELSGSNHTVSETGSQAAQYSWMRERRACKPKYSNDGPSNNYINRIKAQPFVPFKDYDSFYAAACCIKHQLTVEAIDDIPFAGDLDFRSAKQLKRIMEGMIVCDGLPTWQSTILYDPHEKVEHEFWYRNPLDIIQYLLAQPAFSPHLQFQATREYQDSQRIYNELHTADWWWEVEVSEAHADARHPAAWRHMILI
jgi:hypothetical protein